MNKISKYYEKEFAAVVFLISLEKYESEIKIGTEIRLYTINYNSFWKSIRIIFAYKFHDNRIEMSK